MWLFDKPLVEWFEKVKEDMENPQRSEADDRTVVPLMENELSKERHK